MNNSTLVLNADDQPLNVAPVMRAFNLVYKGKAVVVTHDEDNPFVCATRSFKRPTIIRLTKWIYIPHRKSMPLTRHNVFKRDGNRCVYCGSGKKLTLDHVMPRSKGGKNTWNNLVTCCARCNSKKDDKTPKEAGLTIKTKPFAPSYAFFVTTSGSAHVDWVTYFEERKKVGY